MGDVNPADFFRPVAGFPGYRVGRDGRVQCCRKLGGRYRYRERPDGPWRDLKPGRICGGRCIVKLHDGVSYVQRYVHHLVLEAFVGPRPPGLEACHGPDPDPGNNRVENLRWDTHAANIAERVKTCQERGVPYAAFDRTTRECAALAKLEANHEAVRSVLRPGHTRGELGALLGCSAVTVCRMFAGGTWPRVLVALIALNGGRPVVLDGRGYHRARKRRAASSPSL